MQIHRKRIAAGLMLVAICLTAVACEKPLREARKASHRIEIISSAAIDTIVEMEATGKITKDGEKAIARALLDINSIDRELITISENATEWDTATRTAIVGKLELLVAAIARLDSAGVLHIKNLEAQQTFRGILQSIQAALKIIQGVA